MYNIWYILLSQDSEGSGGGCPFCRAEIKGTEQIVVDPFDPKKHTTLSSLGGGGGRVSGVVKFINFEKIRRHQIFFR